MVRSSGSKTDNGLVENSIKDEAGHVGEIVYVGNTCVRTVLKIESHSRAGDIERDGVIRGGAGYIGVAGCIMGHARGNSRNDRATLTVIPVTATL